MVRVAMAVLPLSANCSRKFSLDSFVSSDLRYPGVKDDVDFTCFSFVQSQWLVWLALTDPPLRSDLLHAACACRMTQRNTRIESHSLDSLKSYDQIRQNS